MRSIRTDPLNKPLFARDDEASAIDKETLWVLFQRVDQLDAIKRKTHRTYAVMMKKEEREYYVKMTRLERDIERLQAGLKTIVGVTDIRGLRLEYDVAHAPPDVTTHKATEDAAVPEDGEDDAVAAERPSEETAVEDSPHDRPQ